VYNGVDLPAIDADDWRHWRQRRRYDLGVGQQDTVFLSVAGNFALKGVDQAIRHYARWRRRWGAGRTTRFVVVGGEMTERHERTANLLGVGREVLFVPPTPDIFEWYAAADACVLLSWYDPCSRTVLEAVRCGIPAVTTGYNGAAEILAGGAGIVVAGPGDADGTVAAFEELADPRKRAERADKCRAIADSLSMAEHVGRLDEVYREVARK
jgi:UDP-glucose:(heptosyl)LPS alpha-1,3-glucosyltransferase